VQVFDPTAHFIVQWTLDPTRHIRHMVAGLNGELYVNMSGQIFRLDSKTGKQTGEVQYTDPTDGDIDDFDAMVVGLDGSLLVTWINNTRETDTLLRFDSSGKFIQSIANPIQGQTGEFDPYIYLALDGLGNIFALGGISNTICEYSPQGKLITRFGSKGTKSGQINDPENIAVDSHGQIYIGAYDKVQVFDASGLYLDSFDTAGGAYTMVFDRQDNLFLQDTTKVTRYALREK
jgi:sugar lactone lactonase YvrE